MSMITPDSPTYSVVCTNSDCTEHNITKNVFVGYPLPKCGACDQDTTRKES